MKTAFYIEKPPRFEVHQIHKNKIQDAVDFIKTRGTVLSHYSMVEIEMAITEDISTHLHDGDYLVQREGGIVEIMEKELFEEIYQEVK